jgi:hypothetical protein
MVDFGFVFLAVDSVTGVSLHCLRRSNFGTTVLLVTVAI